MKYKITKVKPYNSGGWKNFNNLRNSDGVKEELEKVANQIGTLETSYHAITRAVAVAKVDQTTLENLISQGKAEQRPDE